MGLRNFLFNSFEHYGCVLRAAKPVVLQVFFISCLFSKGFEADEPHAFESSHNWL